jgi:translation initiation factor 3 subunit A
MAKQQMIIEQRRLESEREEREKKRLEGEKLLIQRQQIKEKIQRIANTPLGKSVFSKFEEDDLGKLDVETILQKQQEEMAKEAKEHLAKMKAQEKRHDHVERAKRIEEIPVIEKFMNEKKEFEKKDWEAHEIERITHLIEDRKVAVATRDRMKRMKEDKDEFLKSLLESRQHIFMSKVADFEKRLNEEKARRLQERKEQRKEERRQKYLEEKEEEEKRKAEELRLAEEEKARAEREILEKEIAEKNRITLEKQQARLREIEERDRQSPMQQQQISQQQPVEPWRSSRTAVSASASDHTLNVTPSPTSQKSRGWVPPSLAQKKALATKTPDSMRDEFDMRPRERESGRDQDFIRSRDGFEKDSGREKDGGRIGRDRDMGRERDVGRERDMVRDRERDMDRGERDYGGRDRDGNWERGPVRDRDFGRDRDSSRDTPQQGEASWRSRTGGDRRLDSSGRDNLRPRDQDIGGTDENWRKPVKKESAS